MQPHDRALRHKIIALMDLSKADRDAILDMLDPDQRSMVMQLVSEYLGTTQEAVSQQANDALGLSPWLSDQIGISGNMSVSAHRLLRECASERMSSSPSASRDSSMSSRPTLLSRATKGFWAGR